MARISVDTSEVRAAVADMSGVDGRLRPNVSSSVLKGAINVQDDLRAQMGGSASFGHLAGGISFDMVDDFEAEIGPHKSHTGAKEAPRRGANIAYFGTSKGGGSVEDPEEALNREIPKFEEALADIAADSVFR